MFFLIGGVQPKTILVDKQARSCPACGHFEVFLKRADHYVSLFFVPLFPVKKGAPFLFCENCRTVFDERGYKMGVEQTVSERRCAHCGRPVNPDFAFCPYCGKAI
ncbi:MAG: zinc ribbon domain-containing protein [Desulfobacterales bacterium]|nr:zinc ribbon domain-containing protein [Desulfobacterales bacterium]